MTVLTRLMGLTVNDLERSLETEPAVIAEISEKVLLMQANRAAQQKRPITRPTLKASAPGLNSKCSTSLSGAIVP